MSVSSSCFLPVWCWIRGLTDRENRLIKTLLALVTVLGMATTYTTDAHYDNPLFCDNGITDLTFDGKSNFVAIPSSWYSGDYQCGDELWLFFTDGQTMKTYALDAGPLEDYSVFVNGRYIPIVVDVPDYLKPFNGLSSEVVMVNVSLLNRMLPQSESFGYIVR